MRVLHVIDSLSGSGGAENGFVREIALFSDNVEQVVVRLFSNDTLEPLLAARGVPVVALGLEAKDAARNWLEASRRLLPIVDEFRPDVIHSSLFASNLVAQLTARRKRIPVVSTFTLSGDPSLLRRYQPGAGSWKASALRSLAGLVARSSRARFRALSHDALSTNCSLLGIPEDRATVIPRGVPIVDALFEPRSRPELGLPEDVPLLINVGRQTAQKGHAALIDVLSLVRRSVPAHLVILGREGDASTELAEAIESAGMVGHVTTVNFTPDVVDHLARSDVFVFTSFMEGLGTAVMEAMAAGAPVVAFDIPPVREATDDGRLAWLIPVGDVDSMAAAVVSLIEEGGESVETSVTEARNWVKTNRSLEAVARQVEELLGQVVLERPRFS